MSDLSVERSAPCTVQ